MKIRLLLVPMLAATLPYTMTVHAQNQPTLAETAAFIDTHVPPRLEFMVEGDTGVTDWIIVQKLKTGCIVGLDQVQSYTSDNPETRDRTFAARMIDLRSISVKDHTYYGHGPNAAGKTVPMIVMNLTDGGERAFVFEDRSMAERVANAFRGLAKLCGAKEEAY